MSAQARRRPSPYDLLREELAHVRRQLDLVLHQNALTIERGAFMSQQFDDLKGKLDRLNTATAGVAEDIRTLKDQISSGMTPAEVEDLKAGFETAISKLEGVDAETPGTSTA